MLQTKLHLPAEPMAHVAREHLLTRLRVASRGGLTLVCAPAGSGKTVLLAAAARRDGNTAWLSVDGADNDVVRFWRHVAATLDRTLGGSALSVLVDREIHGDGEPVGVGLAAAVLNGLAATTSPPVVLVLDDYHLIDEREVHDSVGVLLDRVPSGLRVAMATRVDPPLPLARWRAAGLLTEVRAADLRFTVSEASSLLSEVTGSPVSERTAQLLSDRTEGWVAGLQLAGLSLARRDDVEAFAASFSGSHRFVLDYLTEEVLDRQPHSVRDFLLQTSVLDRLSGPLCDAVTGGTDSQVLLEAVERANLFLVPLDDTRGWWRYHHLFADLLRSRYRRQAPVEVIQETHRRAATWHHDRGEVDDTVRHALAAGDPGWAAEVLGRHADELLLRSEGATLRRWFAELPPGSGDTRRLLLAQARVAAYGGRLREAERLIDRADQLLGQQSAGFEPSLDPAVSPLATPDPMAVLLRAFVAQLRGDGDTAEALAESVLGDVRSDSAVGLIAGLQLATLPWLRGSALETLTPLTDNVARWRALGAHDRAAWSAFQLGQIQRELGRLDDALATYRDILAVDIDHTGSNAPAAGLAHIGIAQVAYLRGDLDVARDSARLGVERCGTFIDIRALATGLMTMARIHHALGEVTEATAAMAEAARISPGGEVVDLLDPSPAERANLLVAQGDVDTAARWVDGRGLAAGLPPLRVNEPAHLALARVLLAQGRPGDALGQLDPLADRAAAQGRRGSLVDIEILRARSRFAADDQPGAMRSLALAVAMAAPQGAIQPLVDEGNELAVLLDRLAADRPGSADEAFLDQVRRALGRRPADPAAGRQLLIVPLSDRELGVLAEIAQGKPNKVIAADLFISLNTVKKHVTHIFDKLGVTNRTAAVARARQLGLLG